VRGRITSSIWEPFFDVDFTIKARLEGTEAGRRDDIQHRCARLERFRRYLLNAAGRIGLYLQQALTSGQGRIARKFNVATGPSRLFQSRIERRFNSTYTAAKKLTRQVIRISVSIDFSY